MINSPEATPLRAAARVAAATTAIAAILYLAASIAIVVITDRANLRALEEQLSNRLRYAQQRHLPFDAGSPPGQPKSSSYSPMILWQVDSQGNIVNSTSNAPELPQELRQVHNPTTATVGGVSMRLIGGPYHEFWLVEGASLTFVEQARQSLMLAEALALISR